VPKPAQAYAPRKTGDKKVVRSLDPEEKGGAYAEARRSDVQAARSRRTGVSLGWGLCRVCKDTRVAAVCLLANVHARCGTKRMPYTMRQSRPNVQVYGNAVEVWR